MYPVSESCLVLPCPALSYLVLPWCLIKDYYLSLYLRLRVPVPPSCVHRDRRPDLTVSGAHSPRFVFVFESFYLFLSFVCLSCGKEVAARHPALACVMTAWEFGGIAASPLAASPHARRSREITPPARLWLNARRPASDSMPTGSPLTQARRIAADSSPPDRRWLKPAGSPLTQARRFGADSCPLAAANPSPVDRVHTSRPGVPFLSRFVSTGAVLISHVLSVPRRLVWGRWLLLLWPRRPF